MAAATSLQTKSDKVRNEQSDYETSWARATDDLKHITVCGAKKLSPT